MNFVQILGPVNRIKAADIFFHLWVYNPCASQQYMMRQSEDLCLIPAGAELRRKWSILDHSRDAPSVIREEHYHITLFLRI